ncbi:MAG TPA: tetratricopeptide repeat protein [Planctomycetota bacterium]|nr:tetratricopeptide repeat protein [Planctomycetota bacterium]
MPIIAAAAVLLVGGIAYLLWSQEKAKHYDEAFRKGMTLWTQRDAERALAEFRKAAQVDPRDPELWVLIGRAEVVSGQSVRAAEAWEEALRRRPAYPPALFERAKEALGRHVDRRVPPPVDASTGWLPLRLEPAGRLQGGAEEAQKILADLREASGHSPAFHKFARGAIHLLDGRYRDAHAGLQEYTELTPWDATALGLVGIAGLYGTLPKSAERTLSEALTRRKDSVWVKVRADARYLQGNYEGAREDYRESGLEKEAEPLFARRIPSQGLLLWLRADAGVEVTGTTVSRWQDQSKGKSDAIPKDPAAGPQLVASAIRGLPAILFSGKEDELRLPDGFEDFSAGLSVFVVGEPMTEPVDEWSFILLATPSRGAARVEMLLGRQRDSDQVVYAAEDLQKQSRPFVSGIPPVKEFEDISALHDPSGEVRLYKRGSAVATGTLLIPRKTIRTRNRVGAGLKGRIAEIVLYNRSLSEMERLGVEASLKERYFPAAAPTEKR